MLRQASGSLPVAAPPTGVHRDRTLTGRLRVAVPTDSPASETYVSAAAADEVPPWRCGVTQAGQHTVAPWGTDAPASKDAGWLPRWSTGGSSASRTARSSPA